MTELLIVGAGPTGLTLACAVARYGVGVRVVDKLAAPHPGSRGKGLNPRSREILADLGVGERIEAGGVTHLVFRKYRDGKVVADTDPVAHLAPTPDAPYDSGIMLPQWRVEAILRDRLAEFGVTVEWDVDVTGLVQDADGVVAEVAGGRWIAADYVAGCDGGHSAVRELLGIPFAGTTAAEVVMAVGDVEVDGLDPHYWHQWIDGGTGIMLCPFRDSPMWQAQGAYVEGRPPSLESFQEQVNHFSRRDDIRLSHPTWLSSWRVNVRMADRYRVGRVLIAGDAAHVHPIAGGLGMNTGIQDAWNLAWKLGLVLTGKAADSLLDTYEEERLPVAAWTLDLTGRMHEAVLAAIRVPGVGTEAVGVDLGDVHGLGIGYRWSSLAPASSLETTGPRPGDRAPDAPLPDGTTLFDAFAGSHFTLLGFGALAVHPLKRLRESDASLVRTVAAPDEVAAGYGIDGDALVLVRPDNHIALVVAPGDWAAVERYLAGLHSGEQ